MAHCAMVAPVANNELTLISWLLVYSWLPLYYGVCFLPPLAISWFLSKPLSAGCSVSVLNSDSPGVWLRAGWPILISVRHSTRLGGAHMNAG